MRPEKGGDTLSLFRCGRAKSSSSAELREEVAGAGDFGFVRARQSPGPSQTRTKHLPDLEKIRYAFARTDHWQMPDGKKKR